MSVGVDFLVITGKKSAQPEQFKSVFHCLWWALVTLTTVGYGDVYPITTGGKIFTSIIVIYRFPKVFSYVHNCRDRSSICPGRINNPPLQKHRKLFSGNAIIGIGVVAIPTALVASALTKIVSDDEE